MLGLYIALPRQAMALQMSMYTSRTCSQSVHDIKGRKSLTGLGFMRLYEMVLKRTSSPRGYSAVHGFEES